MSKELTVATKKAASVLEVSFSRKIIGLNTRLADHESELETEVTKCLKV
jgi:hypothetical protein